MANHAILGGKVHLYQRPDKFILVVFDVPEWKEAPKID